MKRNLLLLALLAVAGFGVTACGGDDKDTVTPDSDVVLPPQQFKEDAVVIQFSEEDPVDYYIEDTENGKTGYNVTELELTESGYYFAKLEKKRDKEAKATRAEGTPDYFFLWGMYFKKADGSYELAGFGSVNIHVETDGSVEVNMTIVSSAEGAGQTSVTVTATVTPPKNNESQDNLNLCRAWDIVSTRVQIEGVPAFYQEPGCDLNSILEYIKGYADVKDHLEPNQVIEKILFSDNGTFSLLYKNEKTDRAHWRWLNEKEGQLEYDWEFGDMGYSFIDGTATVALKPQGSTSQLKLFGATDGKKVTVTVGIK